MASVLRVFECARCNKEYNENESPSDDFCSQICHQIWVRIQSKKLDPSYDVPAVASIMTPSGWTPLSGITSITFSGGEGE